MLKGDPCPQHVAAFVDSVLLICTWIFYLGGVFGLDLGPNQVEEVPTTTHHGVQIFRVFCLISVGYHLELHVIVNFY